MEKELAAIWIQCFTFGLNCKLQPTYDLQQHRYNDDYHEGSACSKYHSHLPMTIDNTTMSIPTADPSIILARNLARSC